MNARVYLRIGRYEDSLKYKVEASRTPNHNALAVGSGSYSSKKILPTVLIALDLNIPDIEFDPVRIRLQMDVTHTEPAVEVRQVIDEEHIE